MFFYVKKIINYSLTFVDLNLVIINIFLKAYNSVELINFLIKNEKELIFSISLEKLTFLFVKLINNLIKFSSKIIENLTLADI